MHEPLDEMLDEYAQISRKVASETGATLCDCESRFEASSERILKTGVAVS